MDQATWDLILRNLWPMLRATVTATIPLTAISFVLGLVLALFVALARISRITPLSLLARGYVSVIRGTPLLVQLFIVFYALPQFGIVFDQFTVAWLSVMIWGGAFNSENFRAGFEAVAHRYREAGSALGFSPLGTFLNVTLPIGGHARLVVRRGRATLELSRYPSLARRA